ncbi:hypothetical protein BCR36DRAFT_409827 [Piromyces finnis]|uniref:Uncharacterized protein n=1 Tax=Piromyces finnis TaxID=1754191 RepID=A0A1Y1VIL5_9FUNG|nr:hypothetical protein BCR36DRAFT_409827 [Piromyces finnis]|eukprot:ORX56635.1 hypothetical protein BCR36DRAFT_409827 [Piromyces finnis]
MGSIEKERRIYPKIGQCCCCCCLSPESSFSMCNALMIIYLLGSPIVMYILEFNIKNIFNISLLVCFSISVIAAVSIIMLTIGASKVNLSHMNQFKIVFLIYILLILASSIVTFCQSFNETYLENGLIEYRKEKNYNHMKDNEVKDYIKKNSLIMSGIIFGLFLVLAYYYLCTCSYIEDIESNIKEEFNIRKMESNQNYPQQDQPYLFMK